MSFIEGRACGVVYAGWDLECRADSDVAVTLSGRPEDPGLCADGDIAETADLKDGGGRIKLVACSVINGDVSDEAPSRGELVLDAYIEDVLVVANRGGAGYLIGADVILIGIEDAVADVDGQVVDGKPSTADTSSDLTSWSMVR